MYRATFLGVSACPLLYLFPHTASTRILAGPWSRCPMGAAAAATSTWASKCRENFNGLVINIADVQAEIDAARARSGGQPYSDRAKHLGFVTPNGNEYRTTRSARKDLGLPWSRQTFKRFHIDGSLIFCEAKLEPVKLDRELIPVYEGRGFWRAIPVWRKDQLEMMGRPWVSDPTLTRVLRIFFVSPCSLNFLMRTFGVAQVSKAEFCGIF